jgi:hypothetical protein
VTAKGFLHSTAALVTAIGTFLAALVALGIFLLGEGVLFKGGGLFGGDGQVAGDLEETFGREGTEGLELDGEKILRNPARDADISFFSTTGNLGAYHGGAIASWTSQRQPTREDCAKVVDTHGASVTYKFDSDDRFCVRSSGGRTAFLAIISDGEKYRVTVWKTG